MLKPKLNLENWVFKAFLEKDSRYSRVGSHPKKFKILKFKWPFETESKQKLEEIIALLQ